MGYGDSERERESPEERAEKRKEAAAKERAAAKITAQFRERSNMTYELECAGIKLSVRMFPLNDQQTEWRLEARNTDTADALVATASAETRGQALQQIATWCRDNHGTGLSNLDWPAIERVLGSVRAV